MKKGNKPERLLCIRTSPNAVIYCKEVIRHGHNSNNDCSFIFRRVGKIATKNINFKSVCLSVRSHGTTRLSLGGFSRNLTFEYTQKNRQECSSFLKMWQAYRVFYMKTKNILFLNLSRSVILRMRNVSDKSYRKNQNTHLLFGNFLFLENRAFYERMWENILQSGRPQMTTWRM